MHADPNPPVVLIIQAACTGFPQAAVPFPGSVLHLLDKPLDLVYIEDDEPQEEVDDEPQDVFPRQPEVDAEPQDIKLPQVDAEPQDMVHSYWFDQQQQGEVDDDSWGPNWSGGE